MSREVRRLPVKVFVQGIIRNFGWHFAILLVSAYTGLKGFIFQLSVNAQLPFFKSIGITGDKYQSYGTVASTPWALKAAIGLLSDTFPLFGYHKRSYILIVSIIGTIAFALLGFIQLTPALAPIAAFLLLLGNLQMAAVDLLCEGKYAEMMVSKPESGSDLVSFVWGLYLIGTFFASVVVGPLADHFNPRLTFIVCLPFAAQIIFPTAAGWLPEERLPPERRGFQKEKIAKHPDLAKLSIVMTLGAAAVGLTALLGSSSLQFGVSSVCALLLCVLGMRWLPKMLARANLYMFLSSMLYVSLPGALDYWFTGDEECVPGGPHFSFTYYITYASLVGSAAGGIGVSAFQRFLSRGSFRTAFSVTCLVKLAASAFDIAIVKRYNRLFGIPDAIAFMLGDAVIYQVAYTLDFMPAVVLTSKVCPKGMEASVFSLLASYQNLGSNMSRALGVALIDKLGIRTTAPCNFEQLPMAIFVAHVILPLLVFPFVFILIPKAKMTDDLLGTSDSEKGMSFTRVPSEEPGDVKALEKTVEQVSLTFGAEEGIEETKSGNRNLAWSKRSEAIPVLSDDRKEDGGDFSEAGDIARSEEPSLMSFTPQTPNLGEQAPQPREIPSSAIEDEDGNTPRDQKT